MITKVEATMKDKPLYISEIYQSKTSAMPFDY